MKHPETQRVADAEGGVPFLSRWSRRKLGREVAEPVQAEPLAEAMPVAVGPEEAAQLDDPVDSHSGKRRSELTDDDMPDVETLDAGADVSMFFGGKVSVALRNRALAKVFANPKYNVWCVCAEYADDYTNFAPLGDIVPHELKEAIAREGKKLFDRLTEKGLQITPEEARAHAAAEFRGERLPDLENQLAARTPPGDTGDRSTDHGMSGLAADEPAQRINPPANDEAT